MSLAGDALANIASGMAFVAQDMSAVVKGHTPSYSGDANGLFDYTSPSTKYVVNASGLPTAGTTLRCDYDPIALLPLGLLVEPERTNYSVNSVWAGATSAPAQPTSWSSIFSGTSPAALVSASAAVSGGVSVGQRARFSANVGRAFYSQSFTAAINTVYIVTLFAEVFAGNTFAQLFTLSAAPSGSTTEYILDGTVVASSTSIPAGKHFMTLRVTVAGTGGTVTYRVGVGAGSNAIADVMFDMPQIEIGSDRSSYIPTSPSAASRNADDITLPLADFPWNDGEGFLRINGFVSFPFLNTGEDALDLLAIAGAVGTRHISTLTWIPDTALASLASLKAVLDGDSGDATVLFIGDSTGNDSNEWIARWRNAIGPLYSAFSVEYALYNGTTETYPAPSSIQTGSGSNTLHIWNASVAGAGASYFTGSKFTTAIAAVTPDVIVINLGHNHYAQDAATQRSQLEALLDAVEAEHPGVPITLMLQNPRRDDAEMGQVIETWIAVGHERGHGLVDGYTPFLEQMKASALYADNVHPSADDAGNDGQTILTDAFMGHFALSA